MKRWLVVVGAVVLTGCSSHTSPKHIAFVTTYGQDAAGLLSRVPGCTGIQAGATNSFPGEVSNATCVLDGHKVALYTWKDQSSQVTKMSSVNATTAYTASGIGWSEIVTDSAGGDAQKTIAQDFADALTGSVAQ